MMLVQDILKLLSIQYLDILNSPLIKAMMKAFLKFIAVYYQV